VSASERTFFARDKSRSAKSSDDFDCKFVTKDKRTSTLQITKLAKADVNGVVSLMSTGIGRPLWTYWTAVSPALQSHSHTIEPICALYFTPSRHHLC
jgi:hypothetical protein